jgi:hypothetical protein
MIASQRTCKSFPRCHHTQRGFSKPVIFASMQPAGLLPMTVTICFHLLPPPDLLWLPVARRSVIIPSGKTHPGGKSNLAGRNGEPVALAKKRPHRRSSSPFLTGIGLTEVIVPSPESSKQSRLPA